jgi:RNA polymerase sigma-70 factor (ECF subfamily)
VLQGAFTRLWREAGRYEASGGSPRTWILSGIRNGAIDRLRRREALQPAATRSAGRAPGPPETPHAHEAHDPSAKERERLAGAVSDLPADQRQAVEMAYFEGLSQTQIAQRLGEPLGTVKTRVRLGMDRLRKALSAPSGGAP